MVADDKTTITLRGTEKEWRITPLEEGQAIRALVEDDRGYYEIPYPVTLKDERWYNKKLGSALGDKVKIIAWLPWEGE